MNRILKFRAWVREGEWDENDDKRKFIMIDGDSFCIPEAFEPLCDLLKNTEDYFIMQFTGLKDKNGKEIYEGDYLRQKTHPCSQNKDSEIDYDPLFDRYEIKWDSRKNGWNAFPVTASSSKDFDIAIQQLGGLITWPCEDVLANPFHYEIIGNIYENPELSQDVS